MTLFMILPLILTSCGDDLTPEEIATKNFQDADVALTLSLWIPTDSDTESDAFKLRLQAVEDAINDILRSNNYSTELDIIAVKDSEYEAKLSDRFEEIREAEKTQGTAYQKAEDYKNKAQKNEQTGLYELAYPDVIDTQLDIFLVRGYDNYITYINNKDAYKLNEFFVEGKVYNALFKLIRNQFIESTKVDGGYYAIPNNHEFSKKAQYVLVNKELFDTYSNVNWEDVTDLYALQSYIESIGASGLDLVVPFVGTVNDVPGVIYLDKENLIASSIKINAETGEVFTEPEFLYELDEYRSYMTFYKTLAANSYVKDALAEGEKAAVQILNGNAIDVEKYADEYYVMQTIDLYAEIDDVFSSMFAVSEHSVNHDRSMQILYLLQDNAEIRTLLQYGIEDVDYSLALNDEKETVIKVKEDCAYKMNILYTGNGYRTYPGDGMSMDDWDEIKDANLEVVLHPFLNAQKYIAQGKLTEEQAIQLSALLTSLTEKNIQAKEIFDTMPLEDFINIFDAIEEPVDEILSKLEGAKASLEENKAELAKAQEMYDKAEKEADRESAQRQIDRYQQRVDRYTNDVAKYQSIYDYATKYASLNEIVLDANQKELLKLYGKICEASK